MAGGNVATSASQREDLGWAKVARCVGKVSRLVKEALHKDSSPANACADVRKFAEKGF